MCLEPAVLVLHKNEIECVEHLFRAKPHETASALVDVRFEGFLILSTREAIDSIRRNYEVRIVLAGDRFIIFYKFLENQFYAHVFTSRLKNVEELLTANADKAVPAASNGTAFEVNLDIVPAVVRIPDRLG